MTRFSAVTLASDGLRLRVLNENDAPALLRIFGDPEVTRYWSSAPWPDQQGASDLLRRDREALEQGTALRLGIERVAAPGVIGTVAVFNHSAANRRAEIGYALARSCWGQGVMHEALSLFVAWLFDACDLHRLEADIDPGNLASARSLRRLGFQREGLLRERWIVDGQVSDTELYGLLAADWRRNRAV